MDCEHILSVGVVSAPVAASLLKDWHGNVNSSPNVGLSLGSCCSVIEVESSANSNELNYQGTKKLEGAGHAEEKCATGDEVGSDCATENSTSTSAKRIPLFVKSSAVERMGGKIRSVISADLDINRENNSKSVADEMSRKISKLPSSHYKGVVAQSNRRWGAQIYEKQQRVWLGTFNTEEEAAKTYDRVALKFRGPDATTNFAPLDDFHPEALFLLRHSKAEIVDMLRKHTYKDKLEESTKKNNVAGSNPAVADTSSPRKHLFEKAVTPSDVGKLNRLVIPKQHAEKYLPLAVASGEKGILLNFDDHAAKTWRFRYSFWKSTQCYVFTKGWSRYVKDKSLQAGDVVSFERSTSGAGQLYISFRRRPRSVLPTEVNAPGAAGGLLRPTQTVNAFPGYRQGTPVLYPAVGQGSIPWAAERKSSFLSPLELQSSSSMQSASNDRKSLPLEYLNLQENTSAAASGIMVFGADLSRSSSSTLSLFPEEGDNHCEAHEHLGKRKGNEPVLFCGVKRLCH